MGYIVPFVPTVRQLYSGIGTHDSVSCCTGDGDGYSRFQLQLLRYYRTGKALAIGGVGFWLLFDRGI